MKNIVEKIKNKKIVKSSSGGLVGSILKIELDNNSFFFFYCAWRLEQNEKVIVTSTDSIEIPDGLIPQKVKLLESNKIIDIQITSQYDLNIFLENDYNLKIFCDISYFASDEHNLNWEYCLPDENKIIEINNHFEKIEKPYY
jgi:hypothetical protein